MVPQSPGASADFTARLAAQCLSEAFRQPLVVDSRPGAGTIIGQRDGGARGARRLHADGGGVRHYGESQNLQ